MSVGDVTQGYRAESVTELYDGPAGGYLIVSNLDGDNPDRGVAPGHRTLWIKDPAGHVGRLLDSVHTITEHDDGTVTVSPSILATTASHGHDWHGYLERGVWREA
jgi:hypothetical protein